MKKRNIVIIAIITVVVMLATSLVFAFAPKKDLKPSEYAIGQSYQFAIKDKKPFIALFYADWCTYCMKFMPKYKIIADVYQGKYNFVMINVDDPHYSKVIKEYAIGSFPTVYIIDPGIDNRILINNMIYDDLGKLRGEFDRYLRVRSMIKE